MCICTFRRPDGIRRALTSLIDADIPPGWRVEFIVVDNDRDESALEIVSAIKNNRPNAVVHYFVETKPGVSYARNRCIDEASGSVLTFIDDDEYVGPHWLIDFILTLDAHHADAVFGPVIPSFEAPPPAWIGLTGAHQRARFPTGSTVEWRNAQTNNVAFRRSLLNDGKRFPVQFAKTGGEDSLFFAVAAASGHKLVWCDKAMVTETVPLNRMTRRWVLERAFNGGRTFVRLQAILVSPLAYVYYGIYGLLFSLILIPPLLFTLAIGHARHMQYARSLLGNLGKVAARFYGGGHYGG
ncbi:glycosyltransferase family 2 protein [Sphaerotilus sp.]|uniref:glycosyltransferase n=1 Tax=Sphaerotilus sp. TaxID=2093942 RepID=UPI00286E4BFB|nr:glycosyltransferase family 2 protein [Sphaerotilus sp.]